MTSDMQAATMDRMRWGKRRAAGAQAEPPPTMNDDVGDSGFELHFCCICGALLGGDLEDEIDGEGWGNDICGDCNRTKNYEALFGR
jgi:hypothetical protein